LFFWDRARGLLITIVCGSEVSELLRFAYERGIR
jgi:hypothetical protein